MADERVAVVVGVGPGLGAAVARRFAREGFRVALMARDEAGLAPIVGEIAEAGGQALAIGCDATDETSVARAMARSEGELGPCEALVYNAGAFQMGGLLDLDAATFERCFKANCMGGFLAAQRVVPSMLEKKRGTLIFTGATASLRGSARFSALAVGKFGLRALAQSLARELGPQGVHVAHVIIDGQIDTPRLRRATPDRDPATMLSPDAIAEVYWQLHCQPATTWTLELDLRPSVERF